MFVRNNTVCPNCGNCRTYDLTIEPIGPDQESWDMHAECIACSWRESRIMVDHIVFQILGETFRFHSSDLYTKHLYDAYSLACDDPLRFATYPEQRAFIDAFVCKFVKKDVVVYCLLDDPLLGKVVKYLIGSEGQDCSSEIDEYLLRTVGL
jgi:hypothetical protein